MNNSNDLPEKFWAGGFLFDSKTRRFFLHQRDGNTKFNPNKWAFFGGLNEPGETPSECFRRELEEEIGLKVKPQEASKLRFYQNEELNTYRCVFFVETDVAKSDLKLGEGAGFDWVDRESLPKLDLTELTKVDLDFFIEYLSDGWGN